MKASEHKVKKGSEAKPHQESGSLMSLNTIDHFFEDFLSRNWHRLTDWNMPIVLETHLPRVDIVEHDHVIEVHAALPGARKENLDISISNQSITIRANIDAAPKEDVQDKYYRQEIIRGELHRTLSLPEEVDGDKAKASLKDGILTVTIPRTEKNKRKIIEVH